MSLTWYLLAFAVAIAAVTAQDDVDHWQMQYYPDPQSDPAGCGRPRPSHVCDPNHMLTEREADQLDLQIESVANETRCPCSNIRCRTKKTGFIIGVALMNKIDAGDEVDESELDDNAKVHRSLDKAQLFAYHLEQNWNLGGCDEDIIILFSREDNVLYTQTGQAAAGKLDAGRIGDVAVGARTKFGPRMDIFIGLKQVIQDYRDLLNGDTSAFTDIAYVRPKVAALTDGASTYTASTTIVSILSLLVASYVS